MDWAFIFALWGGGDNGALGLGLSKKKENRLIFGLINQIHLEFSGGKFSDLELTAHIF